jgi:hypothetical protein|tara:strand:- start:12084 stop:12389 length:306 start_codon:yes stop_codon:yes gene_type:complete
MIHHLVFFRFKETARGNSKTANIAEVQAMLEALPDAIPGIKTLSCGSDFSQTPVSFDFGLYTAFETAEDLEAYRVHTAHQAVVELIKETTSDRAVVDYETA